MKLYYLPGACSLSPHIALREAGLDFELVKVGRDKKTADGRDFLEINPFGYVPALELPTGEILLEGPAIVQYIADLKPGANLAPPAGTLERVRLQSALALINSEIHKAIGALFNPGLDENGRDAAKAKIDTRLGQLEGTLVEDRWLVGDHFTVADAYLYVVTAWLAHFDIDIGRWPKLAAHHARVAHRPAVQAARQAEKGPGKNG
jgi:glutathione S-transferase